MLSETPQAVEANKVAARIVARIFVLFTGKNPPREFQFGYCQLLIFQAREMCGYYANERARPMVTTVARMVSSIEGRRRARMRVGCMDIGRNVCCENLFR